MLLFTAIYICVVIVYRGWIGFETNVCVNMTLYMYVGYYKVSYLYRKPSLDPYEVALRSFAVHSSKENLLHLSLK